MSATRFSKAVLALLVLSFASSCGTTSSDPPDKTPAHIPPPWVGVVKVIKKMPNPVVVVQIEQKTDERTFVDAAEPYTSEIVLHYDDGEKWHDPFCSVIVDDLTRLNNLPASGGEVELQLTGPARDLILDDTVGLTEVAITVVLCVKHATSATASGGAAHACSGGVAGYNSRTPISKP